MVDQTRLEAELSCPSPSIQVQALSYAIGALGAFTVTELRCHVETCYQQSRILLDQCERHESGESCKYTYPPNKCNLFEIPVYQPLHLSVTSINTLQACTLMTVYELKHPNFGRAWMSLGRAVRLAKMMGIDRVDGQAGMAVQWSPHTQPAPLFNPAEAEERRRTFWVLYILDGFACTSTKSGLSFDYPVCSIINVSSNIALTICMVRHLFLYPVRNSPFQTSSKQVSPCSLWVRFLIQKYQRRYAFHLLPAQQ